jgi:hypothetical protein
MTCYGEVTQDQKSDPEKTEENGHPQQELESIVNHGRILFS